MCVVNSNPSCVLHEGFFYEKVRKYIDKKPTNIILYLYEIQSGGLCILLNNIIEQHRKLNPLSETEIQIVRGATQLFLEKGFSKTTHRMIAKETGIGLGTITYHFKTKEDLLQLLIEELMDFHSNIIEEYEEKTGNMLFSYAMEIAAQIALCEKDSKAWDLYYSAYSHSITFDVIKNWAAKKNYYLLNEKYFCPKKLIITVTIVIIIFDGVG